MFAVTQLSHLVIDGELAIAAIGRAAFLLLVVWRAWIYTTWMVNWFDPRSVLVRVVLLGVALASLLMSAAIPTALTGDAALFASAYVGLQLGRNVASLRLVGRDEPLRPLFERVVVWTCASGILWTAGALAAGSARLGLWAAALAVDLAAPFLGFRTPRLGALEHRGLGCRGRFADRFQAFLIIALGDSIVVTGATASARGLSTEVVLALSCAFLITRALWWLYFDEVAEQAQRNIADSEGPRPARARRLHLPAPADRRGDHHGRDRQ
ncbi:MAG: hypothetical protein QOI57_2553 [Rubrobacteraceae bacterium]|nr:hypothetical protein [Rubrobacteraceae bacterium]